MNIWDFAPLLIWLYCTNKTKCNLIRFTHPDRKAAGKAQTFPETYPGWDCYLVQPDKRYRSTTLGNDGNNIIWKLQCSVSPNSFVFKTPQMSRISSHRLQILELHTKLTEYEDHLILTDHRMITMGSMWAIQILRLCLIHDKILIAWKQR
jgi:hypothetical protein